jgi:hypothetical protein
MASCARPTFEYTVSISVHLSAHNDREHGLPGNRRRTNANFVRVPAKGKRVAAATRVAVATTSGSRELRIRSLSLSPSLQQVDPHRSELGAHLALRPHCAHHVAPPHSRRDGSRLRTNIERQRKTSEHVIVRGTLRTLSSPVTTYLAKPFSRLRSPKHSQQLRLLAGTRYIDEEEE